MDDLATHKATFEQHATLTAPDGTRFLSQEDFVRAIAPAPRALYKIPSAYYAALFKVADAQRRGRVSLDDFVLFQSLLTRPDAEFQIAFRLFDRKGAGAISAPELKRALEERARSSGEEIDFKSDGIAYFFGTEKPHVGYKEFCQVLKALRAERVLAQFRKFDAQRTGYVSAEDFAALMRTCHGHRLSHFVEENLLTLANVHAKSKLSYADVVAFENVVSQLHVIQHIVERACASSRDHCITKADFQIAATDFMSQTAFTPMEVDIVFHFAALSNASAKRHAIGDFARLFPPQWEVDNGLPARDSERALAEMLPAPTGPISAFREVLKSAYHFGLGAVAGGIGATVVYPIDLVKTRMQNQRVAVAGVAPMYRNSMDCFRQVVRNEGLRGVYRGLGPQLIGVAPEKAIKLTMNDLVRSYLIDPHTKHIPLWAEVLAGCVAGGSQVIFTNPLEIVKIRLQVAGETQRKVAGAGSKLHLPPGASAPPPTTAAGIVRSLGLFGLYRGAGACLLRDIPFSAIYFPAYARLKKDVFGESPGHKLPVHHLLFAGAIAGMPAAYLTTPADVIKTRLQVKARKGEQSYVNIRDAFRKILRDEGAGAFFKGGMARVLRSSPQFGVTLMSYELLQTALPFEGKSLAASGGASASRRGTELPSLDRNVELSWLRSRNAIKLLMDLDYEGVLPKQSK